MASLVNLTDRMREYLVHEFGTVAFQLVDTLGDGDDSRLEYAVYWYSAAFGAVQRVINFEPDGELFLLHSVLQSTHEQLTNRLRRQLAGEENPVSLLEEDHIVTLSNLMTKLAGEVNELRDYSNTLESIARLGYSTTGNGFYLFATGKLDLRQ